MSAAVQRVEAALHALRQGHMVILTDHPDREDEGDILCAAEAVDAARMGFIIRHSSGIVCLSLPESRLQQLQLPPMVPAAANTSLRGTPFTVSIDANPARFAVTTGVSAADRAATVAVAIDHSAKPDDLVRPGHIFPLRAATGGVLERPGHTEGSLDLVRLAGLQPAAVLCELMNPDGSMARGQALEAFGAAHGLRLLAIDDVIAYREAHERCAAV